MLIRSVFVRVAVALPLSTGCASLAQLGLLEPEVELTEVQIAGLGLNGGTLNLILDVYNPNSYEIRGQRMEIALELDQTPFGVVGLDRRLVLPSREHTAVEVPLRFTWQGVGSGARALLDSGSLPYGLRGMMWVESPIGEHSISIGRDGSVTMRDLIGRVR
jgi:LEA14-like dessication related protein